VEWLTISEYFSLFGLFITDEEESLITMATGVNIVGGIVVKFLIHQFFDK
jgi:hypothetical protein